MAEGPPDAARGGGELLAGSRQVLARLGGYGWRMGMQTSPLTAEPGFGRNSGEMSRNTFYCGKRCFDTLRLKGGPEWKTAR